MAKWRSSATQPDRLMTSRDKEAQLDKEKSGRRSISAIGGWRNFCGSRSLTPAEISKPPYALTPAAGQTKSTRSLTVSKIDAKRETGCF
ncbi:hypothetical protein [Pseudobacillus wudalianchiensis]|uniref:hypothetical protein n=1 Tax=Pseudobacillus wudalianchiensis TaxID=1743143 RepID=UPI0011474D81|nr:hypothetical protein [Bacillus wudalianchiensis]